jgi:hypothetical protein
MERQVDGDWTYKAAIPLSFKEDNTFVGEGELIGIGQQEDSSLGYDWEVELSGTAKMDGTYKKGQMDLGGLELNFLYATLNNASVGNEGAPLIDRAPIYKIGEVMGKYVSIYHEDETVSQAGVIDMYMKFWDSAGTSWWAQARSENTLWVVREENENEKEIEAGQDFTAQLDLKVGAKTEFSGWEITLEQGEISE